MDDRIKKRIIAFYVGGVINTLLGLYVVIEGARFLGADTARLLAVVFFVFAAVDFYFPRALKKKWLEDQARAHAPSGDPVQRQ